MNRFHLAGSYLDRKGPIISDCRTILPGNSIVPWRQRNPKPALVVRLEGGNQVIVLPYDELHIREWFGIGDTLSRWAAESRTYRDNSFQSAF